MGFEKVDYTIDPIPKTKLAELVRKMGIKPRDLLRTKEAAYRDLGLADPAVTDDQILDAMVAHSELIQRPVVEVGDRAVLARPVARVKEILNV
ncbi:MAG TPA: ArsC/Spx/MgsR family protein [Vicinamibacteria bacterium]